ncbi:MAG: hypothetical protein ABWY47_03595, partial [Xanthobacteraceae bacterium]
MTGQLVAIVSFYWLGTALPGSALSGAGVRHSVQICHFAGADMETLLDQLVRCEPTRQGRRMSDLFTFGIEEEYFLV